MEFSLNLRQETKLILTQEMKLSMKILQMSSSNLRDFLEKEVINNPTIEINYGTNTKYSNDSDDYVSPMDFVSKEETLIDYLEEQIRYCQIDDNIKNICIFIVNNLNHKGYLAIPKNEIKKILKISPQQLNQAFEIIYSLEPCGIGAENLKDCLKIQLHQLKITDTTLFKIIDFYLEELAQQDFEFISTKLGISIDDIKNYLGIIRKLSPIPARGYLVDTSSNYIIPEARIELKDDKLVCILNENAIPKISVNNTYNENVNKYNIQNTLNIIKSIEKRYQTLERVLNSLIIHQKEFFYKGKDYLKTLILSTVANELNLHESTISRAIKDKYIETPQGVISIRSLFVLDSNIIEIKKLIEEFIKNENKHSPLSDEKIKLLLSKRGFETARRTISKYREELGIPSTRERKK